MKTEGFIKAGSFRKFKYILLLLFFVFFDVSAYEANASVTLGGGWKSDVDPSFSFRSASDIFNRSATRSSATMLFSFEAGVQSEKESGFAFDLFLNGLISLQSVSNSVLDSGIEGGYIQLVNKNNIIAFIAGINNSSCDYRSMKSLYVDPYIAFSYLYAPDEIYAIFLRTGLSYYFSTSSLVEYLTGPSLFLEGGARFNFNENAALDVFAGSSATFFKDQFISYNRYEDVYYGELSIEGRYFSLYSGMNLFWEISSFSFPVSLKYIFSRSFDYDTHKIVYWSDVSIPSTIYEKVRIDSTIEFSAKISYDINDNFSILAGYFLHKTFSNVGDDFGDYADYSRLAHTVSVEVSYEY
ncbi:MAG TPA: hypothetical protein PL195_00735 [bacterium]|nr:hypothetical protein [bacterium]